MTEQQTIEEKIDLITTWIDETDSFNDDNNMSNWATSSWAYALEEYADTGIKSVITTTISQFSRAAKRFKLSDYPLGTRGSNSVSAETQAEIDAHNPFLDFMMEAYEALPEVSHIHAKKSKARPDRRYLSAKDFRNHWLGIITDNAKEAAKTADVEATQ